MASELASLEEIKAHAEEQQELDDLLVKLLNDELKSGEEYDRVKDHLDKVDKVIEEAEQKNESDSAGPALGGGLEAALPKAWFYGFRSEHVLKLPHAHASTQRYACAMAAAQLSYCLEEVTVNVDGAATADKRRAAFLREAMMSFLRVDDKCKNVVELGGRFEALFLVCKTQYERKRPLGVAPTVILKHTDQGGTVRLFVASRGSSTAADWKHNFMDQLVPWKPSDSAGEVQAHAGFKAAAEAQHEGHESISDAVKGNLTETIEHDLPAAYKNSGITVEQFTLSLPQALAKAVAAASPTEIVFCGHSLGGAVALLHAVKHTSNGWLPAVPVSLVTFACPRAGDQALVNLANDKIAHNVRVFHDGDAVPAIPSEYLDNKYKGYAGHPGTHHVQISGWGNPVPATAPKQEQPNWGSAPRWGAVQKAHRYRAVGWGVVTYHSLLCYASAFWYNLTEDGAFPL